MGKRFILVPGKGLVPAEEFFANQPSRPRGPAIIGDIGEVRSMIDDKVYTSRSHYREHLKDNNAEIVGNDWNSDPTPKREIPDAPGLQEDIARAITETS